MPDIDDPFLEEVEPTAAQVGIDVPGARGGFTDFINFNVYNGAFRVGPPDPSANIDVVGAAGSNFVPGWRYVQSSNTTITAKIVLGASQGAGSNLRFTFGPGVASGHAAYIEQIFDIGGSAVGDVGSSLRVSMVPSRTTSGAGNMLVTSQYLNAQGGIAGMPAERSALNTFNQLWYGRSSGYSVASFNQAPDDNQPPANARYLRQRIIVSADTGTTSGDTVDVFDVRREVARTLYRFIDRGFVNTNSMSDVYQNGSNLFWAPASTLSGTTSNKRLLNFQLVPIPFTVNSIATSATTDMQPFDNAVNHGTPRISMGWPGWLVGMSYRMTGAPTAGGSSALVVWATVAGSQTWKAFTIPGTGGNAADQVTQQIPTNLMSFGASQGLGIQLVTSGTYAPNGTRNMSAILWVALEYDGL